MGSPCSEKCLVCPVMAPVGLLPPHPAPHIPRCQHESETALKPRTQSQVTADKSKRGVPSAHEPGYQGHLSTSSALQGRLWVPIAARGSDIDMASAPILVGRNPALPGLSGAQNFLCWTWFCLGYWMCSSSCLMQLGEGHPSDTSSDNSTKSLIFTFLVLIGTEESLLFPLLMLSCLEEIL